MNIHDLMNLIAGGLQFVVAGYALRLNRIFGPARVGWSLFCAFSLLALLHLFQSVSISRAEQPSAITLEVIYSLVSLLLLAALAHIEALFKERLRLEREEIRLRADLEVEVQKKTAYLTRALDELQAEIDQRKQMETEVQKSNTQLFFASRQVKAAELTTSVMQNMSQMLKSVNVTASIVSDQVKQSKIANVVRIGALIREHADDLGRFMAADPRGQKLPNYIAELARHLAQEQAVLSRELESLKRNIEEIMALEQSCNPPAWQSDSKTATGFAENLQVQESLA
jgi:Skp family chaperone for outer membrane proteins